MLKIILSAIVRAINFLIAAVGKLLNFILVFLPDSPFQRIQQVPVVSEFMPMLNYVLPVSEALAVFELWLSAISLWYLYVIIMRWIKAIE